MKNEKKESIINRNKTLGRNSQHRVKEKEKRMDSRLEKKTIRDIKK